MEGNERESNGMRWLYTKFALGQNHFSLSLSQSRELWHSFFWNRDKDFQRCERRFGMRVYSYISELFTSCSQFCLNAVMMLFRGRGLPLK